MVSCELCGWKEDAAVSAFTDCPCCGFSLTSTAAAGPGAGRAEARDAWADPDDPARRRETAASGSDATRPWWRTTVATSAFAAVAASGITVAAANALRHPDREARVDPMAATDTLAVAAAPEARTPPADVVRRVLERYLPAGYALADAPTLVRPGSGGDADVYRVSLRAADGAGLYRVPVVDLRLPDESPPLLRQLAGRLKVDPDLPPGKEYDLDARQEVVGTVGAEWRAAWSRTADGWRLASADPVVPDPDGTESGPVAHLTDAGVDAARGRRDAALAGYAARCREVERDAEAYHAQAMAGVPPACPAETASLLREVVRLSSECPRISDEDAREACFGRREALNRKFGACQAQDDERQRALTTAARQADDFRRRRVASLVAELAP